eukprot:5507742-Pleurochrysis_carterae.AAC.1
MLASPSLSRKSVAPPIRQHSPAATAIFFATLRDVAVDHGAQSLLSVKNGVLLPDLRCAAGTSASRASHAARMAS